MEPGWKPEVKVSKPGGRANDKGRRTSIIRRTQEPAPWGCPEPLDGEDEDFVD